MIISQLNKIFNKYLLLIFLLALLFQCGQKKQITEKTWLKMGIDQIPEQSDYPEHEAVVLLNEGTLTIETDKDALYKALFEKHKVIKIFTREGFKYGNIIIPYGDKHNVEDISARTISPHGQVTELKKENIFRIDKYPGNAFYSDKKAVKFALPALEEGCIIEYSYMVFKDIRNYIGRWYFQEQIPTEHSRIRMMIPGEWDLQYNANNLEKEPKINQAPAGFKAEYEWELFDIHALEGEEYMPAYRNLVKSVEFAPPGIEEWSDVVNWYSEIFERSQTGGKQIEEFTKELIQQVDSKQDKMKLIFNWVRDNIRYIIIEIDEGNIQPEKASKVFEYRYGDCKDMTALLARMYEASNLKIDPVLISTAYNGKIDTSFATPNNFVHVIGYSPEIEGGVWLDPTAQNCRFGQIPSYLEGMQGLIISRELDQNLKKLPSSSHHDNKINYSFSISADTNNNIVIDGHNIFQGLNAADFRKNYIDLDSLRIQEILEKYLARNFSRAQIKNHKIKNLAPETDSLFLDYILERSTSENNNQFMINPLDLMDFKFRDNFLKQKRTHPIQINYPYSKSLNLDIKIPENFTIHYKKLNYDYSNKTGGFEFTSFRDGNKYHLHYKFELYEDQIPVNYYPEFKSLISKCVNSFEPVIIISKN
ncbi:MAG TPA: DUF3857 domain-containing protein [bacterium]|nr:DUF3857 domain-containing protein [bacterium]